MWGFWPKKWLPFGGKTFPSCQSDRTSMKLVGRSLGIGKSYVFGSAHSNDGNGWSATSDLGRVMSYMIPSLDPFVTTREAVRAWHAIARNTVSLTELTGAIIHLIRNTVSCTKMKGAQLMSSSKHICLVEATCRVKKHFPQNMCNDKIIINTPIVNRTERAGWVFQTHKFG